MEGRCARGLAEQRLRLLGLAGLLQHAAFEVAPARVAALLAAHLADRGQRRRPVTARHRFAHAPLVQAFVVRRFRHRVEAPRRIGQVGRHRPQCDLVQHLALLLGTQAQCLRVLRQLLFGGAGIGLGQLGQAIGGDAPAALVARPVQCAGVGLVDKGRVIVGQRQVGGRQAPCGAAHHSGLLGVGGSVDAFPAQGVAQTSLCLQHGKNGITAVRQRLAVLAPQILRFTDPLRINLAGHLARGQLRTAQAGVVGGRPVGEQGRPVLAACDRGQPYAAERGGHGLAVVALEEGLRLRGIDGVDVAAQVGVLQPAVCRMAAECGGLAGIELAAFGGSDRGLQLRVLGVEGLGIGAADQQRGGQGQQGQGGRRASGHGGQHSGQWLNSVSHCVHAMGRQRQLNARAAGTASRACGRRSVELGRTARLQGAAHGVQ